MKNYQNFHLRPISSLKSRYYFSSKRKYWRVYFTDCTLWTNSAVSQHYSAFLSSKKCLTSFIDYLKRLQVEWTSVIQRPLQRIKKEPFLEAFSLFSLLPFSQAYQNVRGVLNKKAPLPLISSNFLVDPWCRC